MGVAQDRFIAVDWGTTHIRATLVEADGTTVAKTQSAAGVQSVAPGGYPAALEAVCGAWLAAEPSLPVIMAGMVGSRNGWVEAPYLRCPCGAEEIARRLVAVPGIARDAWIVPGVDARWDDGAYEVIRGEETKVVGTGVRDGLVCLPGTHGKWVEMAGGRIARFVTFMTGELYSALSGSFVARLSESPDDPESGQAAAVAAARAKGGITRTLFQARTRVLAGDMPPRAVKPFLSRLLVEAEIAGAIDVFGPVSSVHLVAGEPQLGVYREALAGRGIDSQLIDPGAAVLTGLGRIMAARTMGDGR